MNSLPLILDVDGTLIRSDLTHELLLEGVKAEPLRTPKYVALGLRSKSQLKRVLVDRIGDRIAIDGLPLEPKVVALAKAAYAQGREVYLCSGSEQRLIKALCQQLDFVTDGFGTTPDRNLTSETKADFLRGRFPDGFDYVGNSTQDYAVWDAADAAIAVRPPRGAAKRTSGTGKPIDVIEDRPSSFRPLLKAMRLHQWAKNVLIFLVPMLVLEQLVPLDAVRIGLGFLCLGLLASGTYLINDMLDVHADRLHATKRLRPFASGLLSIPFGLLSSVALIASAFALGLVLLPIGFVGIMLAYFVTTLSYSFVLKRLAIVDVMTLAFLFLIRVAAGAAIVEQPLSPWLVSFVLTFFFSLSLIKRYTEVVKARDAGKSEIAGRGYQSKDATLILGYGMKASAMTLLSFVLYGIVSDIPALRTQSAVLVVGTILTYWLMRLWLLAHRGELDDDPVLFAVKDRLSLLAGALIFGVVAFERLGGF